MESIKIWLQWFSSSIWVFSKEQAMNKLSGTQIFFYMWNKALELGITLEYSFTKYFFGWKTAGPFISRNTKTFKG